jgi:hypothetical protein
MVFWGPVVSLWCAHQGPRGVFRRRNQLNRSRWHIEAAEYLQLDLLSAFCRGLVDLESYIVALWRSRLSSRSFA